MSRYEITAGVAGALLIVLLPGAAATAAGTAAKSPPAEARASQAALLVPADYRYSRAGAADPFKPFLEMDLALKKRRQEAERKRTTATGRPISPLQQAEIGRFRLLGIAGDESRRTAIVADGGTKRYYPLFVGTAIGLNDGRVSAIHPDRVVVEEKIEIRDRREKRVQVRQVQMLLHREPSEGKP